MKMMRALLGRNRKVGHDTGEIESWVDWVQQATSEVRRAMMKHAIPDWIGATIEGQAVEPTCH